MCYCDFDITGMDYPNDLGYCCDDGYTSGYDGACGCNEYHEVWDVATASCVCTSGFERNDIFECCPGYASYNEVGECMCDDWNDNFLYDADNYAY